MLTKLKSFFLRSTVSLRTVLITVFVSFFAITIISFVLIFHFNVSGIAMRTELSLLQKSSEQALQKLHDYFNEVGTASSVSADLMTNNVLMLGAHFVANNPEDVSRLDQPILKTPKIDANRYEMMRYTMNLLTHLKLAQGIYFGDDTGSFIHAMREENGSITTTIINRHAFPPKYLTITRDVDGKEINRSTDPQDYDPRSREWYKFGSTKKQTTWTGAYLFGGDQPMLGITAVTPVFLKNGKLRGVFGVDIPLKTLSDYVSRQTIGKIGQVFILNDQGKIIAAKSLLTDDESLNPLQKLLGVETSPLLARSFQFYTENKQPAIRFEYEGKHYLATFLPLPILQDDHWLLGVVDRVSDVRAELFNIGAIYIIIEIILIVIGLLVISKVVTLVVAPIKKLMLETEKIKRFDLSQKESVPSRIKEVFAMSKALDAMRAGLRSFKKYVPAALVRQLIDAGVDASAGGQKREIALMFTDIENFTHISEQVETQEVMQHVCDYFDVLSKIVTACEGTIDKYIGDSVMAFWGAPLPDVEACAHAARAALNIQIELKRLNDKWQKEGIPPFITRIGLHFGEAIVGNVGSSERLNYTALGDAVNLASRLEGANKIYHTHILASEQFVNRLGKAFSFRKVDEVQLKGREEKTIIYELLSRVD